MSAEDIVDGVLSFPSFNGFFGVAMVLMLPVFLIGSCIKMLDAKAEETRETVRLEAVALLKAGGENYKAKDDVWGSPMEYLYQETKMLRIATVVSAGKDKKMGTDDDIMGRIEDVNKSRLMGKKSVEAGKWVGRKTVEFGKGVMDGLKGEDND